MLISLVIGQLGEIQEVSYEGVVQHYSRGNSLPAVDLASVEVERGKIRTGAAHLFPRGLPSSLLHHGGRGTVLLHS